MLSGALCRADNRDAQATGMLLLAQQLEQLRVLCVGATGAAQALHGGHCGRHGHVEEPGQDGQRVRQRSVVVALLRLAQGLIQGQGRLLRNVQSAPRQHMPGCPTGVCLACSPSGLTLSLLKTPADCLHHPLLLRDAGILES
jgi:hypothetical protein